MQSMTGYGRHRVCADGRELTLELKAVNHRFLDVSFRLPKNLTFLEDVLRTCINQSPLRRGHVDVFVTYQNQRTDAHKVSIDPVLLKSFTEALAGVKGLMTDARPATETEILTASGALSITQADEDAEAVSRMAEEAFAGAAEALCAMRDREGAHLADDLLTNLDQLAALRQQIAERAPLVPEEYRKRLHARLDEWQVAQDVDGQRLAQEVAIMADHCAIDEELSRLEGHIDQFAHNVKTGTEVGRRLDFLLQEMNREVNTMGSKASDADITRCVVECKCIIEKLREQVQNAL